MTSRIVPSRSVSAALVAALGLAAAWSTTLASPPRLILLLACALFVLAVLWRPEIGAFAMLVLVAAVPHATLFERGLPFVGGRLKATDLILLLTIGAWLLGVFVRGDALRLPSRRLTVVLVLLLVVAVASLATARSHGTPLKLGLNELRPLLSFLLVFPLVSRVRSSRQLDLATAAFLVAAGAASVETMLRYVRGEGGIASYSDNALRVNDSMFMFPMLAVVWAVVALPLVRRRVTRLALLGLAAVGFGGLFVTYQRGAWLAVLVAVPLGALLMPGRRFARLLVWLAPLLAGAVVLVIAMNSFAFQGTRNPLASGLKRLESIGAAGSDVSAQYRFYEWRAATAVIAEHPVTGIGLGSSITFWSPMYSADLKAMGGPVTTSYIHNSYIWYALKLGIAGAVLIVVLMAEAVRSAFAGLRRSVDPRSQWLLHGVLATLVAVLVVSLFGSHLNADFSTPYLAFAMAVGQIVPRLSPSGPRETRRLAE